MGCFLNSFEFSQPFMLLSNVLMHFNFLGRRFSKKNKGGDILETFQQQKIQNKIILIE